jgi:hypothetical protein
LAWNDDDRGIFPLRGRPGEISVDRSRFTGVFDLTRRNRRIVDVNFGSVRGRKRKLFEQVVGDHQAACDRSRFAHKLAARDLAVAIFSDQFLKFFRHGASPARFIESRVWSACFAAEDNISSGKKCKDINDGAILKEI